MTKHVEVVRKKATRASVAALVRRRFGKNSEIAVNDRAPSEARRAELRQEQDAARARLNELVSQVSDVKGWKEPLLTAAQFVVDVNGDAPSIDCLRTALEQARRHAALVEEQDELRATRMRLTSLIYQKRYRVRVFNGGPIPHYVVGPEADTLEELAALVNRANVR